MMGHSAETALAPELRRLRPSLTLSLYIARQFLIWFAAFFVGLVGVIFLVSLVDLLDRLANKDASLDIVFTMAALKLPFLSQEALPFIVHLAAITCFWRMNRAHELVVARAVGISIWQILGSILAVALIIGVVAMLLLNPIAATLLGRFEQYEAKYIRSQASTFTVAPGGLWLRQADNGREAVIHAESATTDPLTLRDVVVFEFDENRRFVSRADAALAHLGDGEWRLESVRISEPGQRSQAYSDYRLKTDLTPGKIADSFAPPETVSFWRLREFVEVLERAGFSGLRHELQFNRLLAVPFLFMAMVMLAATFSLRPHRRGRVGLLILCGVLTGFLLYFLSNFVFALGLSGKIPVILAAWAPAGITLLLGTTLLLHLEDG
jgi:lipopolysaccharide export system permease protein